MELDFAMIDAKESDVIEIDFSGRARNKHNKMVIEKARLAYLSRLDALQKEIKAEFEPQLIENKDMGDCDPWMTYCEACENEEACDAYDYSAFGHLWYS